ncbi:MAG: carboxypeptidase regulatory-like domain-containing protein [Bryobacteraceae bacterium]
MTRILFVCSFASLALAQSTASLHGVVTDPSGATVPGATVTIRGSKGQQLRQTTTALGVYEFKAVPPGAYAIRVVKPGFAPYDVESIDVNGPLTFDMQLAIASEVQTVRVEEEASKVSTDPSDNAGAIVLKEDDLKAFSDDPDELSQELQALAGPGAGPNGGQIYIDGFTGGRMPPKSSIREVRVNQNPYSAEFDRVGFGRIEILTKPGTDKFRGDLFFGFGDDALNSRNPFAQNKAPYQSRLFGGRISGPINKKSSFGLDVEGRAIDENAVINATILDSNLNPTRLQQGVVTPQYRYHVSPRLDYQLNEKNTLVMRYGFSPVGSDNRGVGDQSLLSRAFDTRDREHTFQLTETSVLSARTINETRFQYRRSTLRQFGDSSLPALTVLDAFNGGGAQVGLTDQLTNSYEFQNITTHVVGTHSFKLGGRLRHTGLSDLSPSNFGGTFTFAGGIAPVLDDALQPTGATAAITSLERYRRTLLFEQLGYTPAQIRALGGGASQFTIAGGNPLTGVSQSDFGVFATDDWRVKPTLTLSYGLRYENQNNIVSNANVAPRLGLAWALDGGAGKRAKTVLRVGAGMFYDRVSENLTLQALRFNGVNQVNYIVPNPDFYPTIPDLASLASNASAQTVRRLAGDLRTPYLMQGSVGIDRQLPKNNSISVNYIFSRGVHLLRTRNLNSAEGNVYQYESTGFSRQQQLMTNYRLALTRKVSLFGFYALNFAKSDTDGMAFPANPLNYALDYSRTSFDVRHRFLVGGSIQTWKGVTFNPFITAFSGAPFNITTGRDTNGDTIFNDRPAFATDLTAPGVVQTAYGNFLLNPLASDKIIPRNYGQGPGQFSINLRLSRTWGFGKSRESRGDDMPSPGMGPGGGPRGGGPGGPGGGGPMMMGGGRGPGGGGRGGMFGGNSTGKRFNLTLSLQAHNLLNHVNPGLPNGNLGSPLFGQSTQLGGMFGPGGGGAAGNRRVDLQLRLSF